MDDVAEELRTEIAGESELIGHGAQMKKLYEKDWLGIPFTFSQTSHTKLAGPDFYNAFYSKVFEKCQDYESLPADWRRNKNDVADWLAQTIPDGASVLSIGCGLGYMEQRLQHLHGNRIELHVQDYASESLRWLRKTLPASRIHDASEEGQTACFDVIYLSAVDYALTDESLTGLLSKLKSNLKPEGRVIMISASFLDDKVGGGRVVKDAVKALLYLTGMRERGQFWGWKRTRLEYQQLMNTASFVRIEDGFLVTPHQKTYWIEGRRE